MSFCVITNILHFWHSKIRPNLKATAQLAYIITDADCVYERLFNVFIMYPNYSRVAICIEYSTEGRL